MIPTCPHMFLQVEEQDVGAAMHDDCMRAWENNCHTTKVDQAEVTSWNKSGATRLQQEWLDAIATGKKDDKGSRSPTFGSQQQ